MVKYYYVGMPWKVEDGYEPPGFLYDWVIDFLIEDLILHGAFCNTTDLAPDVYDEFVGYYAMRISEYEKDDRFYVIWMREFYYTTIQAVDTPDEYFYVYNHYSFILPKKHCPLTISKNYHDNTRKAITIPQFRRIRDVIIPLSRYKEFYISEESAEEREKCFELNPKKERCYKIYKRKGLDCLYEYLLKHFTAIER